MLLCHYTCTALGLLDSVSDTNTQVNTASGQDMGVLFGYTVPITPISVNLFDMMSSYSLSNFVIHAPVRPVVSVYSFLYA